MWYIGWALSLLIFKSCAVTTKNKKTAPEIIRFQGLWSEMGDSNSRHLAPKASALPTALIPDLGFEFCARCGQTCGQAVFLTTSTCGGSACIAGVSRDCGHGIFWLERGASCSQITCATNCATPGYSISAIIPRRGRKSKIFLSVVNPVVKAAFSSRRKSCYRPCCKAFRHFALHRPGYRHGTPKPNAMPIHYS